jgi:carboxyl-terminal processing protease
VDEQNDLNPVQPKSKSMQRVGIIFGVLAAAVLIFASGWAFGRGNITLNGLRRGEVASNSPLNYSSVDEVYNALKANFDGKLDNEKLLDGLKQGLASASGDPYTEYFNAKDSKDFKDELNGSFEGIGAELGKDGNNVVIISPIAGSPAEKAGIKPRDIIAKIDGKVVDNISVSEAVKQIRGAAGTTVKLSLIRGGTLVEVSIVRAKINVPSVTWKTDGSIGILTISRFADDTISLVNKAADEFADKKVTGIVLDLRNDPGGLLDAAVKLSSKWLDGGTTVLREKRGGVTEHTFTASGDPVFKDVKTVVLINEGSASASEITAGALHDNNAATLMGVKSYGKGSVQQIVQLSSGATLKVTIARWYTPDDKNIDKEGIKPEIEVKQNETDLKNSVDTQLQAALSFLRK